MSALLKDLRQVEAPSFSVQSKRLIDWCKSDALPFWGKYGVDKAGGFYETLNYVYDGLGIVLMLQVSKITTVKTCQMVSG